MSKIIIATVEGIENTLGNTHHEAPRYDGYLLPLNMLTTGRCMDDTLGTVELSGAIRYDQIIVSEITNTEWLAFCDWLTFLNQEDGTVFDNSLVSGDASELFRMDHDSGDLNKESIFSISSTDINYGIRGLKEDLDSLFYITGDNYEGDGDRNEFVGYLTGRTTLHDDLVAKHYKRAMRVYALLMQHISRLDLRKGFHSLVIGPKKALTV